MEQEPVTMDEEDLRKMKERFKEQQRERQKQRRRTEGRTYDDVLIEPQYSQVESRDDVTLETEIAGAQLLNPFIATAMDTVTEYATAQAMSEAGGMGIIHREQPVKEQVEQTKAVIGPVGMAVGVDESEDRERISALVDESPRDEPIICVDVAHGHQQQVLDFIEGVEASYDVRIIAGAIATGEALVDMWEAGVDAVRVGVGSGSRCTTRTKTGVGVPQLTAIGNAVEARFEEQADVQICADGGIEKPGDASKALFAGADACVMGRPFAGTYESPQNTEYRGMASSDVGGDDYVEGASRAVESVGSVADVVDEYAEGVRSACAYVGAETLHEARHNAEFVQASPTTVRRNGVF